MNVAEELARLLGRIRSIETRLSSVRSGLSEFVALTEEQVSFYDHFNDGSIFWVWDSDNTAAGKTITEAASLLTIAVTEGTQALWSASANTAPKVYMGITGGFYEVSCKISSVTLNTNTEVRLQISDRPETFGNPAFFSCGRGPGGVVARYQGTSTSNWAAVLDLPIYFKIRFTGNNLHNTVQGFYSTDGVTWISFTSGGGDYVITNWNNSGRNWTAGLHVENWSDGGNYHAVTGDYDWFKLTRPLGPR